MSFKYLSYTSRDVQLAPMNVNHSEHTKGPREEKRSLDTNVANEQTLTSSMAIPGSFYPEKRRTRRDSFPSGGHPQSNS